MGQILIRRARHPKHARLASEIICQIILGRVLLGIVRIALQLVDPPVDDFEAVVLPVFKLLQRTPITHLYLRRGLIIVEAALRAEKLDPARDRLPDQVDLRSGARFEFAKPESF